MISSKTINILHTAPSRYCPGFVAAVVINILTQVSSLWLCDHFHELSAVAAINTLLESPRS